MIVSLFTPGRRRAEAWKSQPVRHSEYPIEQKVRGRDPKMNTSLPREAWRRRSAGDAILYLTDSTGLRVLGRSEEALNHAVSTLAQRYGERIMVEPPAVRYVFGAQVLEPWMSVLVNVPQHYSHLLLRDFAQRRGRRRRSTRKGAALILQGEAPLADLLGYAQWLRDLTEADPCVATWLSRYAPIDFGPQAA